MFMKSHISPIVNAMELLKGKVDHCNAFSCANNWYMTK